MTRTLDRLRARPVDWNGPARFRDRLRTIGRLGESLRDESDETLRERACELRERARSGGCAVDDVGDETFAIVREAADRLLAMRPYDVQIIAGLVLAGGDLAEMATGEGKTLAAVGPACLHALAGRGVHVLTFNDYLARRDVEWMGPVYELFGFSVGVIQESMNAAERRRAYAADVTYATAKEVGFDFLRGLLAGDPAELVQRPFHYAIVDEADSILVDEARVPLVIAGQLDERLVSVGEFETLVRDLRPGIHYALDENGRNVNLTDAGMDFVERRLGVDDLHAQAQVETMTGINAALHARALLKRDVDYLVRDGRIELIDEFTGRVVEDRHLPDGLQAAVEAKEGLAGGSAGTILGTITLQHLLGFYEKLAGMTATAYTACAELKEFYGMTTVVIPPNVPSTRIDHPDRVFRTMRDKRAALVAEIVSAQQSGRPVLVGTVSVEESERLAAELRDSGVECRLLNAKRDELEAAIVADAGLLGAVTISTNMAGRGTDIRLGGTDENERDRVVSLGGLYVIGTNRHESRRIDDQLRGRSARQGDPGSTRFFVSLEDPLLERFDLAARIPTALRSAVDLDGTAVGGEVDHPLILREIERTQRIVEGQNLDIRRTLTKYSEMVEQQRVQLQERRNAALHGDGEPFEMRVRLAVMDRAWRDHLGLITELRDGIHLRTLARLDPLAEFQKEIIEAFAGVFSRVENEIDLLLKRAVAEKTSLDELGLKTPSSTWTYIVSDDPFRDQLFAKVGGTAMGLGLVLNLWFVAPWALYRWWRHRGKRG